MPINIPDGLPAKRILQQERIFALEEDVARKQQIRPLRVALLNLMPTKIETETQILRLISKSPIQVSVDFMRVSSHEATHAADHLVKFYDTFDDLKSNNYDGLIITGAPVEQMPFESVDYWDELCRIFEWSKTNVYSSFFVCWGAQAALYYKYGLKKYQLDKKMFGVFEHVSLDTFHPLMRGLDDKFWVPHSRHTEVRRGDIALIKDLQILSYSERSGVHLISDMECRNFFSTGHSEYDRDTLAKEYFRDVEKGLDIDLPENYFPDNDPLKTPEVKWRSAANIIFSNWLNYFVYQRTPYDLSTL